MNIATPELLIKIEFDEQSYQRNFQKFQNNIQNISTKSQQQIQTILERGHAKQEVSEQQHQDKLRRMMEINQKKIELANESHQAKLLRGTNSWSAKMLNSISSIGNVAKGFAVAWITTEIGQAVTKSIEWGANINDLAQAIGLSTTQIQGMRYALSTTGTDAQKLETIISQVQDKLTEARNDSNSKSALLFREFGIDTQQDIYQVVDALIKYNGQANISDVVGNKNVTTLQKIRAAYGSLENAMKSAQEAGAIASTETIQRLETMDGKLDVIKNRLQVFAAEYVVNPIFNLLKTDAEQATVEINTFAESLKSISLDELNSKIQETQKKIDDINEAVKNQKGSFWSSAVDFITGKVPGSTYTQQLIDNANQLSTETQKLNLGNKKFAEEMHQAYVSTKKQDSAVLTLSDKYADLFSKMSEFTKQNVKTEEDYNDLIKQIQNAIQAENLELEKNKKEQKADIDNIKTRNEELSVYKDLLGKINLAPKSPLTGWSDELGLINNHNINSIRDTIKDDPSKTEIFNRFVGESKKLDEVKTKITNTINILESELNGIQVTDFDTKVNTNRNNIQKLTDELKKYQAQLQADLFMNDAYEKLNNLISIKPKILVNIETTQSKGIPSIPLMEVIDTPKPDTSLIDSFSESVFRLQSAWANFYNEYGQQISQGIQLFEAFMDADSARTQNKLDLLDVERQAHEDAWTQESDRLKAAGLEYSRFYQNRLNAYQKTENKLKEKETQLQSKAWEQQQDAAVKNIYISTAEAIMRAWATSTSKWEAIAMTALIAATSAVQINSVQSQKNPYKRALGGEIPGIGYGDNVPVMATPGEFIMNRIATQENIEQLQYMNSGGKVESSTKNIIININGDVLDPEDWFKKKGISAINAAIRDGHYLEN